MQKFSEFVLRRKLLLSVLTGVAFVLGIAATALTASSASEEYRYPGLPAYEANAAIQQKYGNGGYQRPFVPVITLSESVDSPGVRAALDKAFKAVAADRKARVLSYVDTLDRVFVSADGRTTFGLVFPGPTEDGGLPGGLGETVDQSPMIIEALRPHLPAGASVQVTGLDTMVPGVDAGGLNVPLKLVLGVLGAIVVLLFVFRSALAFVPLLIAVIAMPIAFVFLFLLRPLVDVQQITVMTIPLIGLGVAVDYALIMVARWREEQALGARGDDAVHRAMVTSGRSVLFSGVAVAIGLMSMVVLPIPFLRGLGVASLVIVGTSVAVSLTLLPIILAAAGNRLDRRRLRGAKSSVDSEAAASRAWTAWARAVVRRRWIALIGAGGGLLALAVIGLGINLSLPQSQDLRQNAGLSALVEAGIPTGVLTSFDVLATDSARTAAVLGKVPGVAAAVPKDELVVVVPVAESGSAAGQETLRRVIAAAPEGSQVGGNAAQLMDYIDHTYSAFPVVLALISLVTLVMLTRAFRSLVLAVKAVALNLLSLGAVLGAMVLLWQWGWGTEALFGIQATGSLGTFVPITIFAFLYGLSMDYEVFILARMREEYDRTGSTTEAVVVGIGRTGRLVTSAALILFFPFMAMAGGGELDVAIFATGVGMGILLDATLVRAVLVPALVATMGSWNWWLPGWAARLTGRSGRNSGAPKRSPAG